MPAASYRLIYERPSDLHDRQTVSLATHEEDSACLLQANFLLSGGVKGGRPVWISGLALPCDHAVVEITGQVVYVYRNTEVCSCNDSYSGKASITYAECVFVALGIQQAKRMAPYCHLWPVRLYSIFSTLFPKGTIFGKRLLNIKPVF